MLTTVAIMACLLAAPERRNPPEAVWLRTVNKTGTWAARFCVLVHQNRPPPSCVP